MYVSMGRGFDQHTLSDVIKACIYSETYLKRTYSKADKPTKRFAQKYQLTHSVFPTLD